MTTPQNDQQRLELLALLLDQIAGQTAALVSVVSLMPETKSVDFDKAIAAINSMASLKEPTRLYSGVARANHAMLSAHSTLAKIQQMSSGKL